MNKNHKLISLERSFTTLNIQRLDDETLENIFLKLKQINAKLYFYDSLTAVSGIKPEGIYDAYSDSGKNLLAGNPTLLNQETLKHIDASSITLSQISTDGLIITRCFSDDEEYFISDDAAYWGESAIIKVQSLMLDHKTADELKIRWLGAGRNNKIKDRILVAEKFFQHKKTELKLGINVSNQVVYETLHRPTKFELWNMLSDFSNAELFPKLEKYEVVPNAIIGIRKALDIKFQLGTDKGRNNKKY